MQYVEHSPACQQSVIAPSKHAVIPLTSLKPKETASYATGLSCSCTEMQAMHCRARLTIVYIASNSIFPFPAASGPSCTDIRLIGYVNVLYSMVCTRHISLQSLCCIQFSSISADTSLRAKPAEECCKDTASHTS